MPPAENLHESGNASDKVCDLKNINPEEGQLSQEELFDAQILSDMNNIRRNRVLRLARQVSGRKKPGAAVMAAAEKMIDFQDSLDSLEF
jgi:hypothetical protein